VLADEIHDAPTVVARLNVLHGERGDFGPAQSAAQQQTT
jgi:hypothetical protein